MIPTSVLIYLALDWHTALKWNRGALVFPMVLTLAYTITVSD